MVTKHDFVAMATLLSESKPIPSYYMDYPTNADYLAATKQWRYMVISIAALWAKANPKFDRDRFYARAGYTRDESSYTKSEVSNVS